MAEMLAMPMHLSNVSPSGQISEKTVHASSFSLFPFCLCHCIGPDSSDPIRERTVHLHTPTDAEPLRLMYCQGVTLTPSCPRSRSRDAARTSLRLQVWRRRASCTARRQSLGGSSTKKSATRVFSSLRTTSCSEHDPCAVCRKVACLQNQSCSQPSIGTGTTYRRFVAWLLERGTVSAQVAFSVSLQGANIEAFLASLESSRTSRGGRVSPGCAKYIFRSLFVVTDCKVKRAPTEDRTGGQATTKGGGKKRREPDERLGSCWSPGKRLECFVFERHVLCMRFPQAPIGTTDTDRDPLPLQDALRNRSKHVECAARRCEGDTTCMRYRLGRRKARILANGMMSYTADRTREHKQSLSLLCPLEWH